MRPRSLQSWRAVGLLASATSIFGAPAIANAADAPLRTIGVDAGGQLTAAQQAVAISPDGRLVLSNAGGPLIRDVVAGTTTPFLTSREAAIGASLDLSKILISTTRAISPKDADTDEDLYVYDRASATTTLASGDPSTGLLGRPYDWQSLRDARISGDGKVVYFRSANMIYNEIEGGPLDELYYQWRYNAAAGTLSQVSTWDAATQDWVTFEAADNAGAVVVNPSGIYVGAKKLPLPFDPNVDYARSWASPDGSTVTFEIGSGRGTLTLVNTASGVVSTVKVPDWLRQAGFTVLGSGNAGGGVVLSTRLNRGAGPRTAIGFLTKTGALGQIGGDIRTTDASQVTALSQNLQFAATNVHLAQLGTTALPGAEPSVGTPTPNALSYVSVGDVTCSKNIFGVGVWTRAFVNVASNPVGTDLRTVASTVWRVFDTASGRTLNAFTLTGAGKSRDLTVPRTGGWSWTVTVKLSDGASVTGTGKVTSHPTPECTPLFVG